MSFQKDATTTIYSLQREIEQEAIDRGRSRFLDTQKTGKKLRDEARDRGETEAEIKKIKATPLETTHGAWKIMEDALPSVVSGLQEAMETRLKRRSVAVGR